MLFLKTVCGIQIILFLLTFACSVEHGSGGDGNETSAEPPLAEPQSDEANPNTGGDESPTPSAPQAPQPLTPADQWRSYRATFDTLQVNDINPCKDDKPCMSFGRRMIGKWYDTSTGKIIPQLVGWEFILNRNGPISMSMDFPVFSDRGDVSSKDGVLTYYFKGDVYGEGAGRSIAEFKATLEPQSEGTIKLTTLAKFPGVEFNKVFILKERPGSKLSDAPTGIRTGLIAMKEVIQKSGSTTEGLICKITATPGSRYLLDARYFIVRNGNLQPWRYILSDAHYGIFDLVLAAQNSTPTMTSIPEDGRTSYYTTFDLSKTEDREIPIAGSGGKVVSTNFKDVSKLMEAIDKICNDIIP